MHNIIKGLAINMHSVIRYFGHKHAYYHEKGLAINMHNLKEGIGHEHA